VTSQAAAAIVQNRGAATRVPDTLGRIAEVSTAAFPKVLRQRLDRLFADQQLSPKADRTMWLKIALGFAVFVAMWAIIYLAAPGNWLFTALYILGGLAQTFLLLNIAHDSNHGAISSSQTVNKSLNYVFDVCGISSYMWRILHHRGHHACINVHGEDDALTGRGLLRFTPHEQYVPIHRFQHIYALVLYAFFSLDYVFVRDFECFFFPSHDYLRIRHPLREYVTLFAGKLFYLNYMLVLPVILLHKSLWLVGGAFLVSHLLIGLSVALVFQTSHTVDDTYFPSARGEFDHGIYHIFATTADYATRNPVVGFLTGGLNHHIAHHLCPFVCHTHYPHITRIARETAAEFNIPYREHPTMTKAVWHHLILLKQLGTEP
jgi:linoleoyl-CoA desaturase